MFGRKKADGTKIKYDSELQYPVVRASICSGEKVAGFKDKQGGHFTEVMLIRNASDMDHFKEMYGLDEAEIRTEY